MELKSEWIEPQKAARRIAGHANAARGESILWLIGVDEDKGVVGVQQEELANWLESIQSQFDGVMPSLVDLNIPVEDKVIVALYIETDRAPFVVKNPSFGVDKGVFISSEVPWREGTSIRSAKRSDLLKLFVPIVNLPEIEILSGKLSMGKEGDKFYWHFRLETYITPHIGLPCILPFHRCKVFIEVLNLLPYIELGIPRLSPPYKPKTGGSSFYESEADSITISATQREAIVEGPGQLNFKADLQTEYFEANFQGTTAKMTVKLQPAYTDKIVFVDEVMHWYHPKKEEVASWVIGEMA
ncbi:ATP-binding protein [Candidatus Bathyarchaeota archaeon]|nr:ATP-binding protein [Candidatus Bathyarchaeota archaeon]